MIHLIGTKTKTACGLNAMESMGDRVSCKRQTCTCSACELHLDDFDKAIQALEPPCVQRWRRVDRKTGGGR
jgi:hypothetical protein